MSSLLEEFFVMYGQDFDIFSHDTDPIDLFIAQHTEQERAALLQEMKALYDDLLIKEKSVRDIKNMGLEYFPEGNRSPEVWLPRFISYLEEKIASR
jgi:CdiI immunity protein